MPDDTDRRLAAYEEALMTIAQATVRCRAEVAGFHVGQEAAQQLLVTCEQALTGLIALGAVPGQRPATDHYGLPPGATGPLPPLCGSAHPSTPSIYCTQARQHSGMHASGDHVGLLW